MAVFSMLAPEESLWDMPLFKITFEFHFDEVLITAAKIMNIGEYSNLLITQLRIINSFFTVLV
jgi:hypothetical protein